MNEKIYDIALEVLKDYPCIDQWVFSNKELEKFAELIILECAVIAKEHWLENEDSSALYTILKHFGVE